jgi:hypothetical protein
MQRDVIAKLCDILLQDFKHYRVLNNLIADFANMKYFIFNASLTGMTLKAEFDNVFGNCALRISFNDLNTLSN